MIPTRPVMNLVNKANTALIEAKYQLLEAERIASSIEEKILVKSVQKNVQDSIQNILKTFFPKTEFDEQAWLKRRRSTDAEHNAEMQKILSDAVATGAFDAKEWLASVGITKEKPTCHYDYSDEGVAKTWKDE